MSRNSRKKLPTEPVCATIESLSHDGRGVTHIEGKAVFIDNALPGEEIEFVYTAKKRKFDEGKASDIKRASPHRVEAKCEFFGLCGGCSLMHLEAGEQIKQKQAILLDNLKHLGHVTPGNVLEPITGPVWGYRRKARLGVKYVHKKERTLVGFREKRNSFIADINRCEVLHPSVGTRLDTLATLISQFKIRDKIPQIEVAVSDEETVLIFRHLVDMPDEDKEKLKQFAVQHDFTILLQSGGLDTVTPLNAGTESPYELNYKIPEYNIEMVFQPTHFTQVNTEINKLMIDLAVRNIAPQSGDNILDLFCGLGNFTLPLARSGADVVGIEGSDDLVQLATRNAQNNELENATFHTDDLFAEFDALKKWRNQNFNKVLLDPPRSGAYEVVQWLPKTGVEKIVYISCNPSTLARDADVLVNTHGFELTKTGVMDMFPHTAHVEAFAVFENKV